MSSTCVEVDDSDFGILRGRAPPQIRVHMCKFWNEMGETSTIVWAVKRA